MEPATGGGRVKSSPASAIASSPQLSPSLRSLDEPDVDFDLSAEETKPKSKTEMSTEAMALLLPGLIRMRRDATSTEEKKKLAEEIDAIEKKLGVTSTCPKPSKCVISRKDDRADESIEGRQGRAAAGVEELASKKDYAAIMLPGLRRMRQSAPIEERARLNKEIEDLELTLGVDGHTPAVAELAVSRPEDRGDAGDKGNASSDAPPSEDLNAIAAAGQSSEMSPELMALLLPGLKRMHRDAKTSEERSHLTEEITAIETSLTKAGVDVSAIHGKNCPTGNEKEEAMRQEFANLMLPGLRRMRQSATSDERARINEEIDQLEDHLGVAHSPTVGPAKDPVSRK